MIQCFISTYSIAASSRVLIYLQLSDCGNEELENSGRMDFPSVAHLQPTPNFGEIRIYNVVRIA
jgi:hypothetical protein